MVNHLVPEGQLDEVVAAFALKLANGPTLAFGLTKRAMHGAAGKSLSDSLLYESMLQDVAGRSNDRKEGVEAFLEKRPAVFQGD